MSDLLNHMLTVFLGFFAIMNPIANTAVFVGLTGTASAQSKRVIAIKSLFIAFCVVLAFAGLGKIIFHMFGITLPALRITGGILVFLIGYQMLHGKSSGMHQHESEDTESVAISPLAVPILAGPGTIATAMNYSASGSWAEILTTVSMFALMCLITFICFVSGQRLVSLLGTNGITIVTRLMGLLLAVIGAQMLLEGVLNVVDYHAQLQAGS